MENWVEITIHTTNEASEIVESILLDYGSTGVAIEDPTTLEENLHDDFGTIIELSPADYPEVGVKVLNCYKLILVYIFSQIQNLTF